ncbi:MAG: LLM class flavin-dependent oxidoreductase, partial [Deltaproteobacteria bacterium]|nr:LLM class flavin-dependent oxidoreductase [Deltaproteobacteria bacterium]
STPIKMYLTAVRPRMLQLGGEIGDGVLLSGGCSPGYIARCVSDIKTGAERAGRSLVDRDVAGFVTAAVSDDPKEAIEANKMFLAYVFRNVHHAENIRLGGGRVDQEGLAAAVGKRDWEAAKKFISDEVVLAHSVAGTPAECQKQLEAFVKGGLNLPVLLPTGTQEASFELNIPPISVDEISWINVYFGNGKEKVRHARSRSESGAGSWGIQGGVSVPYA